MTPVESPSAILTPPGGAASVVGGRAAARGSSSDAGDEWGRGVWEAETEAGDSYVNEHEADSVHQGRCAKGRDRFGLQFARYPGGAY